MAQYGLIEAGGTKFVIGIADERGNISASHRVETTTPDETIGAAIDWFTAQKLRPAAIGIGSFGPLNLESTSPRWGHITNTPKPGWSGTDLCTPFSNQFGAPVAIDTDVNGAALAEAKWGAGVGFGSLLYLTIGTGIGGGFVSSANGQWHLLHGISHPEMGHIRMPRHPGDTNFAGSCPFHGDCLEGLASGPAIKARWGASLSELGPDHPGAAIIGWYLAQAMVTYMAVMEPARIVLGGGVSKTPGLLAVVRSEAEAAAAGYFVGKPGEVIVAPGLGEQSGLMGALALALTA